ncbi:hypothetical protein WJX75_002117 [Coccomyxa subellipsoidea]|uniref:Uncharacterized protein n=1 Tax=Coccomyxa subellipsoidea TaxID=248742 RepID=A0ABR2YWE7_9CHLO
MVTNAATVTQGSAVAQAPVQYGFAQLQANLAAAQVRPQPPINALPIMPLARPASQQPVVQNHQWATSMSQPGIHPHSTHHPQYQSHVAAGLPVYRPQGPQATMQPSLPQALLPQQQRPLTDEDRRVVPKRSIERLATMAGGSASSLGKQLAPSDVAPYLERTWNLYVPGFGSETVQPYKRVAVSELHSTRAAAVRRTIAEASAPKDAPVSSAQVMPDVK